MQGGNKEEDIVLCALILPCLLQTFHQASEWTGGLIPSPPRYGNETTQRNRQLKSQYIHTSTAA